MKRVAVISAILERPDLCQYDFNSVISSFKGIIKGRMGIPLQDEGIAIITVVIIAELDEINSLTGKLGNIEYITVKTSISKKEIR
jgi:putative iron-only hydrogenase system regulator